MIKIESYSNISSEGLTVHLSKKSTTLNGSLECDSFWFSWDSIGEALIKNYK